jgi:peptide/nickel transport system permease protein
MTRYVLRHILSLIVTLFLVSVIIVCIFSAIPGDPVTLLSGTSASPEQLDALREKLNLNQSLVTRYAFWLKNALHGDFGESIQYARPVKELILDRLAVTSTLALLAIVLILGVSIPLGILLSFYRNTAFDAVVSNALIAGLSVPNYLAGIVLIWLFGIVLHLFTPGGFVPFRTDAFAYFQSLLFPAIAVAIPNTCMMTKFIRTSINAELQKDYVRTAESKGATRGYILRVHVLKNAAVPVLTMFGILLAEVLSGSIILEQVFTIPGIGRLLIGGINARDFPLVMTIVLYTAFIVVTVNFAAELLVRVNDPRMGASLHERRIR